MSNNLTKKQKDFIREYAETGNGTQSALKAYDTDSESVANAIAVENLQKPMIQNAIKSIADAIPNELLHEVHIGGLKAGRTVKVGDEEQVEPDYAVRHKYLDSAYKLKGSYAAEKSINLNVQANIADPKSRELAMKYEEELKQGL